MEVIYTGLLATPEQVAQTFFKAILPGFDRAVREAAKNTRDQP